MNKQINAFIYVDEYNNNECVTFEYENTELIQPNEIFCHPMKNLDKLKILIYVWFEFWANYVVIKCYQCFVNLAPLKFRKIYLKNDVAIEVMMVTQ